MNIEDIKAEFPKMPIEMKKMVESEVEKQIKQVKPHFIWKKAVAAAAIAVLACGTTVYAGVKIYEMRSEKVGEYGANTTIAVNESGKEGDTANDAAISYEIPSVRMNLDYLPEGMTEMEEGKYSYASTPYQGGLSLALYKMDQGDDAFEVLDTNVVSNETITAGGHHGVYLQFHQTTEDATAFNQRIYLSFPEVHYVAELFIGADVSKEEAINIAEGLSLSVTNDATKVCTAQTWSEYVAANTEEDMDDAKMAVAGVYQIGDTISATELAGSDVVPMDVQISDVQILDDISVLDDAYISDDIRVITDAQGKLLPDTIQLIKSGDGVDSVDEVVEERSVNQKLVFATVDYTNTSDTDIQDLVYYLSARCVEQTGKSYQYMDDVLMPGEGDTWDRVSRAGWLVGSGEMAYYDVKDAEGKNHISSLAAGETMTVHMGFIVDEDQLSKLMMKLDSLSGENGMEEMLISVQ